MKKPIIVLTSTGSEQQAIVIAEELIQQELAASINILPAVKSIYRFKGKIFDDEENLLIVKTTADLFDDVAAVIAQFHTYEVPEIMGIPIAEWKDNFLDWLSRNVRQPSTVGDTSSA